MASVSMSPTPSAVLPSVRARSVGPTGAEEPVEIVPRVRPAETRGCARSPARPRATERCAVMMAAEGAAELAREASAVTPRGPASTAAARPIAPGRAAEPMGVAAPVVLRVVPGRAARVDSACRAAATPCATGWSAEMMAAEGAADPAGSTRSVRLANASRTEPEFRVRARAFAEESLRTAVAGATSPATPGATAARISVTTARRPTRRRAGSARARAMARPAVMMGVEDPAAPVTLA